MLEARGLAFRTRDASILEDIGFALPAGGALLLLGPSGSGKTTLLRLLAGFLRPSSGSLHLGGRPLADGRSFIEPLERRVGMAFQHQALWPHLTVRATLAFMLDGRLKSTSARREEVGARLAEWNLESIADQHPSRLSGGQAQAVNLARALMPKPKMLLLDEPFTGMDPLFRARWRNIVETYKETERPTLVVATHYAAEVPGLYDHALLMDGGRVRFFGNRTEFEASNDPFVSGFREPAG